MKRRIVASVLPFLLLGGVVAAWATSSSTPRYYATDLGVGRGYDINDAGLVAGYAPGTDGTSHAVVWDSATGQKTDLGIAYSAATGINAEGVVAGYAWSGGLQYAFRWQNGVRTDLGTLPGDTQSAATGINASGHISGWSAGGSSGTRAFVWTDGTMTDIGGLGGSWTVPNAINDAGEVAGTARPTGDPMWPGFPFPLTHAFRWDAVTAIGDLDDGTSDFGTEALGMNASGDVVGVSWNLTGGYYTAYATLWRNETAIDLNGYYATAVNDATDAHGVQIVGTGWFAGAGGQVPTLWELDDAGGVTATKLGDLVDGPGGVAWPTAINDSGQIVGMDWSDHVVVLTPGSAPPPPPPPPPPPSPPPAPASLSAQAGTALVTLSWSPVSVASSYAVKRATGSGGPYATIATVLPPSGSYTDTAAPLGSTSFYVVTASNAGGEGPPSPVASAAPLPFPPPAPASLSAQAGTALVTLSWSPVSVASSYAVKRGTASGGPYATIATVLPAGSSYIDTTAPLGSTSFYVVTASNAGGEGPPSPVASAAPLPYPPTNLTATAGKGSTKSQIDLRWTASRSQNVAQYRVYRRDPTGDVLIATVGPSTSFTVTPVSRRSTYTFVMTALVAGGQESVASNDVSVTTQ